MPGYSWFPMLAVALPSTEATQRAHAATHCFNQMIAQHAFNTAQTLEKLSFSLLPGQSAPSSYSVSTQVSMSWGTDQSEIQFRSSFFSWIHLPLDFFKAFTQKPVLKHCRGQLEMGQGSKERQRRDQVTRETETSLQYGFQLKNLSNCSHLFISHYHHHSTHALVAQIQPSPNVTTKKFNKKLLASQMKIVIRLFFSMPLSDQLTGDFWKDNVQCTTHVLCTILGTVARKSCNVGYLSRCKIPPEHILLLWTGLLAWNGFLVSSSNITQYYLIRSTTWIVTTLLATAGRTLLTPKIYTRIWKQEKKLLTFQTM